MMKTDNSTSRHGRTGGIPDPMGTAIADYHKHGIAGRLRVFSPDFDEDEIPVDTLFREYDGMPHLEQTALPMAGGRVLDIGAGAGCHSLALLDMGKDVTAIDISEQSVETMRQRGVRNAMVQDIWLMTDRYDTILMLMNGIGIVGKILELPRFFRLQDNILADGGQVLIDSSDICYVFETDDDIIELPEGGYYGELQYQMQYKRIKSNPFSWLYIDFETLAQIAAENGYKAELIEQGSHYDYLARITKFDVW